MIPRITMIGTGDPQQLKQPLQDLREKRPGENIVAGKRNENDGRRS